MGSDTDVPVIAWASSPGIIVSVDGSTIDGLVTDLMRTDRLVRSVKLPGGEVLQGISEIARYLDSHNSGSLAMELFKRGISCSTAMGEHTYALFLRENMQEIIEIHHPTDDFFYELEHGDSTFDDVSSRVFVGRFAEYLTLADFGKKANEPEKVRKYLHKAASLLERLASVVDSQSSGVPNVEGRFKLADKYAQLYNEAQRLGIVGFMMEYEEAKLKLIMDTFALVRSSMEIVSIGDSVGRAYDLSKQCLSQAQEVQRKHHVAQSWISYFAAHFLWQTVARMNTESDDLKLPSMKKELEYVIGVATHAAQAETTSRFLHLSYRSSFVAKIMGKIPRKEEVLYELRQLKTQAEAAIDNNEMSFRFDPTPYHAPDKSKGSVAVR